MRDAMCRYMYIYFSNCSHQTFILLDCCSAADVRTVVNDITVARKALKIHSGGEQEYSDPASGWLSPNSFRRTIKSSSAAQVEREQSTSRPNNKTSVGVDENVSCPQECPSSLHVSNGSPNVASNIPIGDTPPSDHTITRAGCRSSPYRRATTYSPVHPGDAREMEAKQEIEYAKSVTHRPSWEVRSASSSAGDSLGNRVSERPVSHLGEDDVKDMASHLPSLTSDKVDAGRSPSKLSWAAQVEEENQTRFILEQPASLWEIASKRPRVGELLRKEHSKHSNPSLPKTRKGETRKSESAVQEGLDQSAILPSPLLRASRHIRSPSEEGSSEAQSGISTRKLNATVKEERATSIEHKGQSLTMHEAVVTGPDPAVLSGDKYTRSSAAPKQSQQPQGAATTFGVQQDKALSGVEASTPSELLFKGESKASHSDRSQRTDYERQQSIGHDKIGKHSLIREARSSSSAIDAGPIEMTWAQRVQAGGSKGTVVRNSGRQFPSQNLLHKSSAYGTSRPKSGVLQEPAKNAIQVSAPPAKNLAPSTVSPTHIDTSRSGRLSSPQIGKGLNQHQLPQISRSSHGQRPATDETLPQAQSTKWLSDETKRIEAHSADANEDLTDVSHSLARRSPEGMDAEEGGGSEWQVVVRKSRVPQTAKLSKPTKAMRRKAKALKKLSQAAPAASTPIENAALFSSTPKLSPTLPPPSSVSPSSGLTPTLLKPSYAAVASLRSPVMSVSSSTTSSADALFFSAPQSPEQPKPSSDVLLESPESSDIYLSASEDMEDVSHRPTLRRASEGHSGSYEAPAVIGLAETDRASNDSAQASRKPHDEQALATADIGARGSELMADVTVLGWENQDQSSIHHRHSLEGSLEELGPQSLRLSNRSKEKERKPTQDVSFGPLGRSPSIGISCESGSGGSLNVQGRSTPSRKDSRASDPSNPSGYPEPLQKMPEAGTVGQGDGTKTVSSHHSRSEASPKLSVRENDLYSQDGATPLTEATLADHEESSVAPEPTAPTRKDLKQSHNSKNANHNFKTDSSTGGTATPSPPKPTDGQQVSPFSTSTSPADVLASSRRQEQGSAPSTSQFSTPDFSSEHQRRGRAGAKVSHKVVTSVDMPREGSILRGEAPEFTPQTTPSKSRSSHLESRASFSSSTPEGLVQSLNLAFGGFTLGDSPIPLHNLSSVPDNPKASTLMPWMSKEFWLPGNTGPTGHETQCALNRKRTTSQPREQMLTTSDFLGHVGQIRRLKPCNFIKVEQAVEQIGTWCPRCNPDY